MKNLVSMTLGVGLICCAVSSVFAQPGGGSSRQQRGGPSVAGAPGVGESLPDVALFDEDGTKVNLAKLKGNYSVVVFGCLT